VYNCSKPAKPFQAKLKINHSPSRVHQEHLGYYPTAEEAALAVARRLGPRTLTTSADIKKAIASSAEARIQRAQQAARAQDAARARCQSHLEATAAAAAAARPKPPSNAELKAGAARQRAPVQSRVVMPSAAASAASMAFPPGPLQQSAQVQQSMAAMGMMSYGGLPGGMPAAAGSQAALQQYQQAALAASAGYPPPAGAPPPGSMGMVPYQLPPGHPGAGNVVYVQLRRDALQPVADDVGYLCSMIDVPADSAAAALTQSGGDRASALNSLLIGQAGGGAMPGYPPLAQGGALPSVGGLAPDVGGLPPNPALFPALAGLSQLAAPPPADPATVQQLGGVSPGGGVPFGGLRTEGGQNPLVGNYPPGGASYP